MKSNVYTRGGDKGLTSLVGGKRVPKNSARLEAYGSVDELNSWLGLAAASETFDRIENGIDIRGLLTSIQHRLFDIGSSLATEPESQWQPEPLRQECVNQLEVAIDKIDALLPRHNQFIIPGGSVSSGRCQVARTVARRAERAIITLNGTTEIDPLMIPFVNRLSDLLFVIARYAVTLDGKPEIFWQKFKF